MKVPYVWLHVAFVSLADYTKLFYPFDSKKFAKIYEMVPNKVANVYDSIY
jgi:hypothetical protein